MAEGGIGEEVLQARLRYERVISSLPVSKGLGANPLRNYNGYWFAKWMLPGIMAFSEHFQPRDSDTILTSPPKCGTTWLMALAFATVTRKDHDPIAQDHPLLSTHPHDLVLYAEYVFFLDGNFQRLDRLASPRIIMTHIPYELLPVSVTSSKCRVVHICRNPKDAMVSAWHFYSAVPQTEEPISLGEAFEAFCDGKFAYGPIWDHCLGYWRESLKRPNKVLFLKYEEMKEKPLLNLKKLAGFVGCPFSKEEESKGVPEKIIELCSFKKLSSTEENTHGYRTISDQRVLKNSSFFRKGRTEDWKNYLTTEMARKLDQITEEKLHGSGLTFGTF